MRRMTVGRRTSMLLATLATCGLGLALAACGDDEEEAGSAAESGTSVIAMTVSESESDPSELTVPDSIQAGVAEITLTNEGKRPHSAQLVRTEGEHDEAEVLEGLSSAMRGKAFPEWFFAGGGTGSVGPGDSVTVTQAILPESSYWVVDDEVSGKPEVVALGTTEAGDAPAEIEPTQNLVTAIDFGFEAETLTAGEPITFDNAGEQPHHMIAVPILGDATMDEVVEFFETEKGQPPVDFEAGEFTSVLEGGTSQVSSASLDAGRYALACFISNREGGPPHVALGMVDEVTVE